MKSNISLFALLFIFLFQTGWSQERGDEPLAEHYKTAVFDAAIFPETYSEFLPQDRFTPSKEQVDKAEEALRAQLKELNKHRPNQSSSPVIHKNLHKYRRQYFGAVDKNGKRYLLINAFWKEEDSDENWLNGQVMVLDGGSYYWQVKYYLEEDKLDDLMVNGYA